MVKLTASVDRSRARKLLLLSAMLVGLIAPSTASATITSVFSGGVACETKTSGAEKGQRWCGAKAGTTVPSWDGTPIDVSVDFPVASGSDKNYPIIVMFPGFGAPKILPTATTVTVAPQTWLTKGYMVFSMSPRGWGDSCGKPSAPPNTIKPAPCEHGYIHLAERAYDIRDAQYLLGLLADEGAINPQAIGARGTSNGGGMTLQFGSLKDRVELPNHELIPWTSPHGVPMKVAAIAPDSGWTDLAQAEWPNGSELDYVANSPYAGPLSNHRWGIEKEGYQVQQMGLAEESGYLGPTTDPEGELDLTSLQEVTDTGDPFTDQGLLNEQEQQLTYHGAYYTSLSEPPAPALIQNGWNDDLFPVDQSVDYYNKVRAVYPNAAIKLYYPDLGHNPRSPGIPTESSKGEALREAWFAYYLKGEGAEPTEVHGGVTGFTSACPKGSTGAEFTSPNWASLSRGEIRYSSEAEQTVQAPGAAPANSFETEGTTICTTQSSANNASAAEYKLPAAPASGVTMLGAATVIAELATPGEDDQVIARLYDENVSAGTEQLIARQAYRPLNPGNGFTKQVFQLHPQAWKVAAGHVLKLELLAQDSPYMRTSSAPDNVEVRNLEIRIPSNEVAGSAEGMVQALQPKYLPAGYTLARNEVPSAPTAPHITSGSNPSSNGQFTLSWEPTQAATAPSFSLEQKNASSSWSVVASSLSSPEFKFGSGNPEGEGSWTYRVTESNESSASEPSAGSGEVKVDETAPYAPTATPSRAPDYEGGRGWYKDGVEVTFAANGDPNLSDGSPGSGVDVASIPGPQTFDTSGSHTVCGTVSDNAGNVSEQGCVTVQVDATPPSLEIDCPATAEVGAEADATYAASDAYSGLATESSGTVPIDTSEAGEQTVSTTAVSNVGLETTRSCTTVVEAQIPTPGRPALSAGTTPNDTGVFTLSWTGDNPMAHLGLSYTLQELNHSGTWTTVAIGIEALSYAFEAPGEAEGTWVFRVQASDPQQNATTEWSPASEAVVVDETAPNAPTATPSRAPDFAGGGSWYKDSVEVTFAADVDPNLSDASPGSGVNLASIPAAQTFDKSGSHVACGAVSDNAGNVSEEGCVTVQVDATPPSLEISCPATAAVGSSVQATITASDEQSGLAANPSGMVTINTSRVGDQTITRTAIDNVGHETTRSCATNVVNTTVISGTLKHTLVVKTGEAVELTAAAQAKGIEVQEGGSLDVEGATTKGIKAVKGSVIRICGAKVAGLHVSLSSGPVTIGEASGCAGSSFSGSVVLKSNAAGITMIGGTVKNSVNVLENAGGTTVTENTIAKNLTVRGNVAPVTDTPNTVGGKKKAQAIRRTRSGR